MIINHIRISKEKTILDKYPKVLQKTSKEGTMRGENMVNYQTQVLKMKDDIMFKAFFSRTGNEIYLKDFLNAILGKEIKIKKVMHDARLEQLAREQKYG